MNCASRRNTTIETTCLSVHVDCSGRCALPRVGPRPFKSLSACRRASNQSRRHHISLFAHQFAVLRRSRVSPDKKIPGTNRRRRLSSTHHEVLTTYVDHLITFGGHPTPLLQRGIAIISKNHVGPQLVPAARATSHACVAATDSSHQNRSRPSDGTRSLEPQTTTIPSSTAADDDT